MMARADALRAPVDRTSLSWQRVAANSALVAIVAAATALQLGEPLVGMIAAALALVALVVGATTPRARRSTVDRREPWPLMVRTLIVLLTSSVVVLALVVSVVLDSS